MANYRLRHHIVTLGNPFSDEKSAAIYINERIHRWMYDEIIIIVPKNARGRHLIQNNICYYTVRNEELC
jgi:hypothetical protein